MNRADATGQPLVYVYFEEVRQRSTKRLTRDEARRMAVKFAKPVSPRNLIRFSANLPELFCTSLPTRG